jgi:hypothetical protein
VISHIIIQVSNFKVANDEKNKTPVHQEEFDEQYKSDSKFVISANEFTIPKQRPTSILYVPLFINVAQMKEIDLGLIGVLNVSAEGIFIALMSSLISIRYECFGKNLAVY